MSPRRHVDDLFTGAYDDDLSPIDEARFQAHLRACPDCSAGYTEFTATVEALRELPKARMARVVHLPSTAPVAEESGRRRIGFGWLNAGLLRRFPATALAGAAAVAIVVVALAHTGGGTSSTTSIASGSDAAGSGANRGPGIPPAFPAAESACTQQLAPVSGATLPAGFSQAVVAHSLSQPGDHLDLAASSLSVAPGQQVRLYAQLSVPLTSAGAPGAHSTTGAIRAVRPCVSIALGSGAPSVLPTTANQSLDGASGAVTGDYAGNPVSAPGSGSLVTFTVPSGLAPGTVIHVEAEIPAGFEFPGSRALTATIDLTTR
jgi:anti-sigma factor RsiW